jgi:hypothetical protein
MTTDKIMFLIDVFRFFENLSRYLASAKEYAMPKKILRLRRVFGIVSPRRADPSTRMQGGTRCPERVDRRCGCGAWINIEQRLMNELKACAQRQV